MEISCHLVTIPVVERNFHHKVITVSSLERESRHFDVQVMRKKSGFVPVPEYKCRNRNFESCIHCKAVLSFIL